VTQVKLLHITTGPRNTGGPRREHILLEQLLPFGRFQWSDLPLLVRSDYSSQARQHFIPQQRRKVRAQNIVR